FPDAGGPIGVADLDAVMTDFQERTVRGGEYLFPNHFCRNRRTELTAGTELRAPEQKVHGHKKQRDQNKENSIAHAKVRNQERSLPSRLSSFSDPDRGWRRQANRA